MHEQCLLAHECNVAFEQYRINSARKVRGWYITSEAVLIPYIVDYHNLLKHDRSHLGTRPIIQTMHDSENTPRNNPFLQNRLSEFYQALIHQTWWKADLREINLMHGFSYGMASASAQRNRLATAVAVRKWSWKYCKDSYMNAFNKPYPLAKRSSAHPDTDCLAASNGVTHYTHYCIKHCITSLLHHTVLYILQGPQQCPCPFQHLL